MAALLAIFFRTSGTSNAPAAIAIDEPFTPSQGFEPDETNENDGYASDTGLVNDRSADGPSDGVPALLENEPDAEASELSLREGKIYELFAAHVDGITSIDYVRCTAEACESTYTATAEGHRDVGELFPLFLTEMGAPSSSIRRVEISAGAYKYVLRVTFP